MTNWDLGSRCVCFYRACHCPQNCACQRRNQDLCWNCKTLLNGNCPRKHVNTACCSKTPCLNSRTRIPVRSGRKNRVSTLRPGQCSIHSFTFCIFLEEGCEWGRLWTGQDSQVVLDLYPDFLPATLNSSNLNK